MNQNPNSYHPIISQNTQTAKSFPGWLTCFLLMIVCCLCVFIGGSFFVFQALNFSIGKMSDVICSIENSSENELKKIYENKTTEQFKKSGDFSEFKEFVENSSFLFSNCKEIFGNLGNILNLLRDTSVNYSNNNGSEVINIEAIVNGFRVKIQLSNESRGSELKINSIEWIQI